MCGEEIANGREPTMTRPLTEASTPATAQNIIDSVNNDCTSAYRASELRFDYPLDRNVRANLADVAFLARSHMRHQLDYVTMLVNANRLTEATADVLREYIEKRIAEISEIEF